MHHSPSRSHVQATISPVSTSLLFFCCFVSLLGCSFAWIQSSQPSLHVSRSRAYQHASFSACRRSRLVFSYSGLSRIRMLEFFNREDEIRFLTQKLREPPLFTILIGPPSSGKTALARHVLESTFPNGTNMFHSIFMNLRGVQMTSKEDLVEVMRDAAETASNTDSSFSNFLEGIQSVKFDYRQGGTLTGFGAGTEVKMRDPETPDNHFLNCLVDTIPKSVPDNVPYVMVVDEANTLKELASRDNTVMTLSPFDISLCTVICRISLVQGFREFLNFIVRMSKEERRLHDIFTSSDSFFSRWIVDPG